MNILHTWSAKLIRPNGERFRVGGTDPLPAFGGKGADNDALIAHVMKVANDEFGVGRWDFDEPFEPNNLWARPASDYALGRA